MVQGWPCQLHTVSSRRQRLLGRCSHPHTKTAPEASQGSLSAPRRNRHVHNKDASSRTTMDTKPACNAEFLAAGTPHVAMLQRSAEASAFRQNGRPAPHPWQQVLATLKFAVRVRGFESQLASFQHSHTASTPQTCHAMCVHRHELKRCEEHAMRDNSRMPSPSRKRITGILPAEEAQQEPC